MNTFPSKRNHVTTDGQVVTKRFANPADWAVELDCYQRLASTGLTPTLLSSTQGQLRLTHCHGASYFDAWETAIATDDLAQAQRLCQLFIQWYQGFQAAIGAGYILGDSHFRNFICTDTGLVGVDFETVTHGTPEAEFAHFAMMLATCRPVDDPVRRAFARMFLASTARAFDCNPTVLSQQLTKQAQPIALRRGLSDTPAFHQTIALLQATITVTGVVLAGGRSRRMTQDKRTLPYGNGTMLSHAGDLMAGFQQTLLSQRPDQPSLPPLKTIADTTLDCGPMGGIVSTLPHIATPYALYIPCDMPKLTPTMLQRLLLAMTGNEDYLCYVQEGRLCTFPLLLRMDALSVPMQTAFAQGAYTLHRLLKKHPATLLPIEQTSHALVNINTPADVHHLGGAHDPH